ncbi:hypothetical protein VTK26DRAFT_1747 [Humicola hyalothermophila]
MSATARTGEAPTNLGPLTTTFTPPPACTVAVGPGRGGFLGIGAKDKDYAYLGQTCSRGKIVDATTCWPEPSKGAEGGDPPLHGWGFYSPGLHCPVGYATACSATGGSGGKSEWPVQFRLRDGETAVGCCPSGYGCANIDGQTCTMIATSTAIPTVTCDGNKSGGLVFRTVPDPKVTTITALSLSAPMIQIVWQSSDRSDESTSTEPTATGTPRTTAPGTKTVDTGAGAGKGQETLQLDDNFETRTGTFDLGSGGLAGPPTATGNPPTLHDSEQSSDSSDSPTLSSAAKVGLGVAGAALVLVVFVCGLFYCWRRRKNEREEQEMDRLYGMKHAGTATSGGEFTSSADIPGWYRGQRLATPTRDPFGEGMAMPTQPSTPYYRPYRP